MPEKTLGRADLLACEDLPVKTVAVPDWGGAVYIRRLTAGERDTFDALAVEKKGLGLRTALCIRSLCDASGQRLFKDDEADLLAQKSARSLDVIFDAASTFNALHGKDDLEKNSESGQPESSSSN
jgi:hypothetical protein